VRGLEPLRALGLQLRTAADFPEVPSPEETGATYRENASLKATWWATRTGLCALADDSGLEVRALGGAPGPYSAVWAGPEASDADNNRELLAALAGATDRRAIFRCCLALAWPDRRVRFFEGSCEGTIAERPAGDHGFGYDPLFYLPEAGATLAELPPEVKDRLSHRGRALGRLRSFLARELGAEGECGSCG